MDTKPFFFVAGCLGVVLGGLFYITQDFLDRSPPEFKAAQTQWRSLGFRDYNLRIQLLCFCDTRPILVQVRDGHAVDVRYEDDPDVVPKEQDLEYRALTIDDVFERVARAYSKSSDHIKVTYDTKYGYPTYAEIDESKTVVDDEWKMIVDLREVLHGA